MAFNPAEWEAILAGSSPSAAAESGVAQPVAEPWARVTAAGSEAPEAPQQDAAPVPLFQLRPGAGGARPKGRPKKSISALESLGARPANPGILKRPASLDTAAMQPEQPPSALAVPTDTAKPDIAGPFFQPPKRGRISPSSDLMLVLPMAQQHASLPLAPSDMATHKVAAHFAEPDRFHMASTVVLERLLGVDSAAIESRLQRLAAALWVQQVYERLLLEDKVVSILPSACLLFYLDYAAYDETPMKITLKDPLPTSAAARRQTLAAQNLLHPPVAEPTEKGPGQVVISKVLQTRGSFGMVLRHAQGILAVLSDFPTPLQSMQRTTGACLFECLVQQSAVSHAADRWPLKLRAITADKAGYNRLGEALVAQARGPGWISTLFACDVHSLARCHSKVFEALFPQHITGMVRCALSLRFQVSWATFRTAVLTEIESRAIEVVSGRPPTEVQKYQRCCSRHLPSQEQQGHRSDHPLAHHIQR